MSGDYFEFDELKVSSRIKFPTLRNLFAALGKNLSHLLASPRIAIYLRGRESGNWAIAVSRNLPGSVESVARVINQEQSPEFKKALISRQPCLLEEALPEEKVEYVKGENLILAPMHCENEVMGLLLADFDAFATLSDRHLIQLNLAALIIKTGIEKEFISLQVAQLQNRLSEMSRPDARGIRFSEQLVHWLLNREIERTARHGGSFAMLLISVDNLAHIITQYGRSIAEKALDEHYELMNHYIRKCDLLTRYSGDKFLSLSLQQNIAGAVVLGEKLRHRIKESEVKIEDISLKSTISIGITLWPDEGEATAESLILRAETALKDAQSRGNRVRVFGKD